METTSASRETVLRRLRAALERQRERLVGYLQLLECQEKAIFEKDVDRLRDHVMLEREVVVELQSLQRVIDPLEQLYQLAYPQPDASVSQLRGAIGSVRRRVIASNVRNQSLLRERLDTLRAEIRELRAPTRRNSPFTEIGSPSLLDVSA